MYYGLNDWLETIIGGLILMCIGFLGWFAIAMIYAVIATLLWNWLVPVIFGLPAVGYLQMFGLMLLIRLMFPTFKVSKKDKKDD